MAKSANPATDSSNSKIDIEFSKDIILNISIKNHLGRIKSHSKVSFKVTPPVSQRTEIIIIDRPIRVSGCILPGLNPHGEEKKCQDNYTFLSSQDMLLCALFDGHGSVGEQISDFCVDFTTKYFSSNMETFQSSPKSALISLLEECDAALRTTRIHYDLSGSTAVVVLITSTNIHTASLGDSRAVLGTLANMSFALPPPANKFCRHFTVGRVLKPIPLTVDQKPNHDEEFLRIRKAGGQVDKVADIMGNKLGPYRVWLPNSDLPGLAMSRSIGDGVAKSVGVISTPVYHYFTIYGDTDQFIVMASDGIWDVMDNMEVVVFIEKFKEKCENSNFTDAYPAAFQNSSISRMLCEEARYRWFGLIEAEDVNIDDISCIVIDISRNANAKANAKKVERNVKAFQSLALDGYVESEDMAAERIEEKIVGSVGGPIQDRKSSLAENEVVVTGEENKEADGSCSHEIHEKNKDFAEGSGRDTEKIIGSEENDESVGQSYLDKDKAQSDIDKMIINEKIEIFVEEKVSNKLIDNEEPMSANSNSDKIETPREENSLEENKELLENSDKIEADGGANSLEENKELLEDSEEVNEILSAESNEFSENEKFDETDQIILDENKVWADSGKINEATGKILKEDIFVKKVTLDDNEYSQDAKSIIKEDLPEPNILIDEHERFHREEISKTEEDYEIIHERDKLMVSPEIISKSFESSSVEENNIKMEVDHIDFIDEHMISSGPEGEIFEKGPDLSDIEKVDYETHE